MLAFILNYKPNKSRIKRLSNLLFNVSVISEIRILSNESSNARFTLKAIDQLQSGETHYSPKELSTAEKSIYHKHYLALQYASQCQQPSLILEDDVIFDPAHLSFFLDTLPSFHFDFIFFGTGIRPPKRFYSLENSGDSRFFKVSGIYQTKCADSIIVSPSGAKKLLEYIDKTGSYLPIDVDMSRVFFFAKTFDVLWLEPGITFQGSQQGLYMSTIQKNTSRRMFSLLKRLKALLLM